MSHFCLFSPLYLNLSYFLSHGVSSVVTSPRAILFYFICSSALTPEAFRSFSFFCLSFFFVCFCFHSTLSFCPLLFFAVKTSLSVLSASASIVRVLFLFVCFCFYSPLSVLSASAPLVLLSVLSVSASMLLSFCCSPHLMLLHW